MCYGYLVIKAVCANLHLQVCLWPGYVLQGAADQTRLSVGQTFGSLGLIQRLPPSPVHRPVSSNTLSLFVGSPTVWALTWKYLPASQNQIIYDLL